MTCRATLLAAMLTACSGSQDDDLGHQDASIDGGHFEMGVDGGDFRDLDSGLGDRDAHMADGSSGDGEAGNDAAQPPTCAADGNACDEGAGVCCGGACVPGDCCVSEDCATRGPGFVCTERACIDVAGSLSGLRWELPCGGDANPESCTTAGTPITSDTKLGGAEGVLYDVSLRFRGIVEQRTYTGGCQDGSFVTGGSASNSDSYNIYRLDVSDPPQVFFLNAGSSNITNSWVIDYTKTIRVAAGATLTLTADAVDSLEIKNRDAGGSALSIDGIELQQPYNGQFIQMDVVDVVPNAVALVAPQGTSGGALLFSGAQLVTVPRAEILEPQSLTLEAWFTLDQALGVYNSVVAKPDGSGTADSYVIWYEASALRTGANLNSTAGSVAVPWSPASGVWHHAALSYDADSTRTAFYIDGLLAACTTGSTPVYDTHALLIGADIDNQKNDGFWAGKIDEVRLFSTARTGDQIWADMHAHKLGPTTGLVGEWTFDEGDGQVAQDSSGQGNDGVLGTSDSSSSDDPTWTSGR